MKKLIVLFIFSVFFCYIQAQNYTPPISRMLFLFDGSQSMLGNWESNTKINIARSILYNMIDSLDKLEYIEMALRVYGHQSYVPPQDCNDTKLEVPFGKNNGEKIKNVLKYINPKGTTPIAHSLELAQFDFPKCDDCRNIIVLITDGIEACDGDPCEISRRLQKEGIYLKPFIIGIGFDPGLKESFNCVGDFYSASNEKQFKEVLNIVITRALNSTSAQINLLDSLGKPTETNVNMTFIDNLSGKVKYNFMHTLNYKGLPDTLILDPLINYRVRINTLPPVYIDSMKLIPGKHTTFYADAHQGYLIVKSDELKYRDIKFIVREAEKSETLTYQQVNEKEKYITGNYDIEIPTIPVIKLQNVGIYQSQTTTIEIPRPGMVTFLMNAPGYGSIYKETDEGLEWIYNLNTNLLSETVLILPGNYKVVFRPRNANRTYFTVSQSFSVKSRSSSAIKL